MTVNSAKLRKYFTALIFTAVICFILPLYHAGADALYEPPEDFEENLNALPNQGDLDTLNTIVTNPASMIIIVAFIAIVVFVTVGLLFRIRIKKKTSEAMNTSEVSNSSVTAEANDTAPHDIK